MGRARVWGTPGHCGRVRALEKLEIVPYYVSRTGPSRRSSRSTKITLEFMFGGAESFNQPLNDWNVSNVDNMSRMFFNAESFNQPLNDWNVSNVTNMDWIFLGASSFNQPLQAPWSGGWYHE